MQHNTFHLVIAQVNPFSNLKLFCSWLLFLILIFQWRFHCTCHSSSSWGGEGSRWRSRCDCFCCIGRWSLARTWRQKVSRPLWKMHWQMYPYHWKIFVKKFDLKLNLFQAYWLCMNVKLSAKLKCINGLSTISR